MTAHATVSTMNTEMISLKPVEDCSARLNMMTKMFSGMAQETQDTVDLKISMTELEELLGKEMRTWWDLSTLKSYIESKMVPRGLRIKKFPSMPYNDEFKQRWESILTDCSLDLMRLITSQEELILVDVRSKITTLQDTIKNYSTLESFISLDQHMKDNLNKLEKSITDIKQSKFMRDLQDYKTDNVYMWGKQTIHTPRSILRRSRKRWNKTPTRVNFSSTEAESSDTPTESADDQHDNTAAQSGPGAKTKRQTVKQPAKNSSSKNGQGIAEQAGNTGKSDRYPSRYKKK